MSLMRLGKLSNQKSGETSELVQIGGWGVVKKSKKSQVSVGKSSKLGGGGPTEIKQVLSSRGYQRQHL